MIKLTIYRVGETIEVDLGKPYTGKDFPSNTVIFFTLDSGEVIKIRPYYRHKIGGILNIFSEEEVDYKEVS